MLSQNYFPMQKVTQTLKRLSVKDFNVQAVFQGTNKVQKLIKTTLGTVQSTNEYSNK